MMNKVILIGRLGRNVETRTTANGKTVASFTVATNETWTDEAGEKRARTDWHNVTAWGGLADVCEKHLSKGQLVCVEGRLQRNEWTTPAGEKRHNIEIVASRVLFLSPREGGATPF